MSWGNDKQDHAWVGGMRMIDYTRAKAKRDSCFFCRQNTLGKLSCEKLGYKRPFLAACSSCGFYAPRFAMQKMRQTNTNKKNCSVCGATLPSAQKHGRCPITCKNSLFSYVPRRKIIIEELPREEDLYGIPLT